MKGILGLVGIIAATGAFSQDAELEASKSAGLSIGKPYASLQLRHYNNTKFNKDNTDKIDSTDVYLQGRAYLGTVLMDGKVDTSLALKYKLEDQSAQVTTYQPSLNVTVTAYDGTIGSVKPYFNYYPETDVANRSASGELGLSYGSPSADLGGVKLSAALDAYATYYGSHRNVDATVTDSEGKKIPKADKKDEYQTVLVKQEDPGIDTYAGVDASYSLAAVKGLGFGLGSYYYTSAAPEYTIDESGKIDSEYKDSDYTETYLKVGYKVTDSLKLDNTIFYYTEDFYGDSKVGDSNRYVNRIRLSYNLF